MTKEETINYFYELQILNVHRYAQEVVVCRWNLKNAKLYVTKSVGVATLQIVAWNVQERTFEKIQFLKVLGKI
jgi:hypothetical protein